MKNDPMKQVKLTQKLTETGLMLALATILSIFKLAELPYGGSITLASMLPLIIVSYRYGLGWGSLAGFVFGMIQTLLGMNNLSYATTVIAAVAIVFLDYLFAFSATALGALFRGAKRPTFGFGCAALVVCAVRYLFHVISGCTVWAGLSIPTADALLYSLIYNATYMVPETIVTCAAAIYISSLLDFSEPHLKQAKKENRPAAVNVLNILSGLVMVGAVIAVVVIIFPSLQNAESGSFDITGIRNVQPTLPVIIAAASVLAIVGMQLAKLAILRKNEKAS